jgi:MULE transposase domain
MIFYPFSIATIYCHIYYHTAIIIAMDTSEASIPAPSDNIFSSYEEAYNALRQHGIENGYGFRLKRSRPYGSDFKTNYYYRCDKDGNYISQATTRETRSRSDGCPFSVVISKIRNTLERQWRLKVANPQHSHGPSLNPSAHHVYRRRTEGQKHSIQSMSQAGIAPKQILTSIRQGDSNTFIAASDIRNERLTNRLNYLQKRTPIEALLDELSTSSDWIYEVKTDPENRVQNLFFMHVKQAELLRANPDILLMDCTYRTNKYRLPLLHILGCTNLQTFFSAGFCFLRNETQEDYYWAVSTFLAKTTFYPHVFISDQEEALKSAVRELLPAVPQLLCVWHINKNVLTKAQHVWRNADGETVEEKQAITEKRTQFMAAWNKVRTLV